MLLVIVYICVVFGVNVLFIIIEVYISNGLLGLIMVGLLEIMVKEVCDWVCSVIINSGYEFLVKKIIINFVLVDLLKEGGRYDLFIVVVFLVVFEQFIVLNFEVYELVGELVFIGVLCGVSGVILSVMEVIRVGRNIIVVIENVVEVGFISKEGCFIVDYL